MLIFMLKGVALLFLVVVSASNLSAQTVIKGKIVDATTKEALPGVTIKVKGKKVFTASGIDGSFSIKAAAGDSLELTSTGYLSRIVSSNKMATIELTSSQTTLKEVVVTNNIAIARKTPVAVSTINLAQIEEFSPNREFPELLENTPSVNISKQGGGNGDSRIAIRGFEQAQIAVMVNGVPVNDMENSSVYWSNWKGMSEIGAQIQVQRGLGNSKLSTPAVGGSINVITKASEMRPGTMISASVGNSGFEKTSVGFSTGKGKSNLAYTMLLSHETSSGYVHGTASEVYNYFATLSWEINSRSTLTATATGAPQWHNMRVAQTYQTYYGNPLDSTVIKRGPRYNNNWGYLSGKEFNTNMNFYHKPVANINYYYKINPKTELSAILYGSIGRGGGTSSSYTAGTLNGYMFLTAPRDANNLIRFDDIATWNGGAAVKGFGTSVLKPWTIAGPYLGKQVINTSKGLNRVAAMNEHNWYGTIVNLTHTPTKYLELDGGLDVRIYRGLHYRRVQDALGSDAFYDIADINNPAKYVAAGDKKTKIFNDNDDLVKQLGGYLGGSYEKNKLTISASGSYNTTSYQRIDYFLYTPTDPNRKSKIISYNGYSIKGGVSYRINNNHFVFGNIGYFEKAPLFGSVFYNYDNTTITQNLHDETTSSEEVGYNYRSSVVNVSVNIYHTKWNKNLVLSTTTNQGTLTTNINGLIEDHKGIELESVIRATQKLQITAMGSLGDWRYKNNVNATIYDDQNKFVSNQLYYLKDVKVGSNPQNTFSLGARYELIRGLSFKANYRFCDALYADFGSSGRSDVADSGRQAWKLPDYGLLNTGVIYTTKIDGKKITLELNVDNILDKQYIAESSSDTPIKKTTPKDFVIGDKGSGKLNTVYPGFGRTWAFTAKINL